MPTPAQLAVLNPAIVGQAKKAHGAVLKRLLADTTLDEQQWITLQFATGAGDALGAVISSPASAAQPSTTTPRLKRRSPR
jgi:hypothetical protein